MRTIQQTHPDRLARIARTDLSRLIIPGAPRMIIFALLPFQAHTQPPISLLLGTLLWSVLELDLERREAGGGMGEPIDLHYPK